MLHHNGDFMHICSECKISFGCAELRRHMVTQSKGKAYNCVQCHKSFGQAGHLKMHRVTHTNEKEYTSVELIQSSTPIEDAHGHPHWGESSQMCRMWRFIWWGWAPGTAHAHSQWGEATQVHTMRLCMSTGNHSKKAHQNTFLTKAKSMQMVRLLFNHKIQSQSKYTHPKRRKATSL